MPRTVQQGNQPRARSRRKDYQVAYHRDLQGAWRGEPHTSVLGGTTCGDRHRLRFSTLCEASKATRLRVRNATRPPQKLVGPNVAVGSKAALMALKSNFRFSPESRLRSDIVGGP